MGSKAPTELVKEANSAHELFLGSWRGIRFNEREFGRACDWIQTKQLHKYIRKGKSKKGYISMDEYVREITNGECTRTRMFECINLYKLTTGTHPVSPATVDTMPKSNALQLARVPEKRRSKKLVERAVTEPIKQFKETAQDVINGDQLPEKQEQPMSTIRYRVHSRVAQLFEELMEDVKLLPCVRDFDNSIDWDTKAIAAITTAARTYMREDILAAKDKLKHDNPEIETETQDEAEDYAAPNAGVQIGTAEAENRLIHHKSEVLN